MYTITMFDNDGTHRDIYTEKYNTLDEFKAALNKYGVEYNGQESVTLIW